MIAINLYHRQKQHIQNNTQTYVFRNTFEPVHLVLINNMFSFNTDNWASILQKYV